MERMGEKGREIHTEVQRVSSLEFFYINILLFIESQGKEYIDQFPHHWKLKKLFLVTHISRKSLLFCLVGGQKKDSYIYAQKEKILPEKLMPYVSWGGRVSIVPPCACRLVSLLSHLSLFHVGQLDATYDYESCVELSWMLGEDD